MSSVTSKFIGDSHITLQRVLSRDVPYIAYIEKLCFAKPWSEEDLYNKLKETACSGFLIAVSGVTSGYVIYRAKKNHFQIDSLAVDPMMQRQGLGTRLINMMLGQATTHRHRFWITVRESNLGAQLFLREMGFRCMMTERDTYRQPDGHTEDGYLFSRKIKIDPED